MKTVKQISLDVLVGKTADGECVAEQIRNELEMRGYTILGAGFQADLSQEYNIKDPIENLNCLIAQLMDKIQSEYDVYIEKLRHLSVDEIIEKAYKTSMIKEFKCCIENSDYEITDIELIRYLIQYDNLLENLYEDWKKYDSDEFEIYKEFVFGYWNKNDINDSHTDFTALWDELYEKYPEDRERMSKTREREFVKCCFDIYEKEGFSEKFWSPYEDGAKHIGKSFKVLNRTTEENNCLSCLPLWDIELEDGTLLTAYPEEIIPSEIKNIKGN